MRLTAIACLLLLLSTTRAQDRGAQTASIPEFENIKAAQKTPVWCWAACIEMVLRAGGVKIAQQDIVTSVKGRLAVETASIGEMFTALNRSALTRDGQRYAVSSSMFRSPPAIPLINELSAGRPVILGYQHPGGGHVVIAKSLQFVHGDASGPTITRLEIYDPFANRTFPIDPRVVPRAMSLSFFSFVHNPKRKTDFVFEIPAGTTPEPVFWFQLWLDDKFAGYAGSHKIGGTVPVRRITIPGKSGKVKFRLRTSAYRRNAAGFLAVSGQTDTRGVLDLARSRNHTIGRDARGAFIVVPR